jgi:hypothetical protein
MCKVVSSPKALIVTSTKKPSLWDFLNQNENKGMFNSKSKSKNKKKKKKKTRSQQVQNKNSIGFYCNDETKTKQGCDKKTYQKLVLNKLKVMENSTFIYSHWALSSKNFFKKLPTHMWPMFTPCPPIYEL